MGVGDHGDKLPHRTVALTTRADGRFRYVGSDGTVHEGAPAPFLIHKNTNTDPKNRKLTKAQCENLCDPNGNSPDGLKVVCDLSGSMTTASFAEWTHHFVDQLPPDQGRETGEFVFLFLDGHGSRWSYEGLSFLRRNRVIAICLPSHTSIWGQV